MDATPEVTPPEHIPPKIVSLQARQTGRLERRAAGEFPVLEAFQQFLESERRRARRHMLLLTGLFLTALVVVLLIGGFFGTTLYREVTRTLRGVHDDLQAVQAESVRVRTDSANRVRQVSQDAAALRSQFAGTTQDQQRVLAEYQDTVSAMQRQLATLERHNAALSADMESVQRVVPSLSTDMSAVVQMIQQLQSTPAGVAPGSAAPAAEIPDAEAQPPSVASPVVAASPGAPPPARTYRTVTMVVTPRGSTAGVPWRLVIPE